MATTLYDLSPFIVTEKTIKTMHRFVKKAKTDYKFISLMSWLVKECSPKDALCEVKTLYNHFKKTLRYISDPHQVELVQSVWRTLERGDGDCDDLSLLIAGAAGAVGRPYRFVTIKADLRRPTEYSHVYTEIEIPEVGWMGADLTVESATLGWEPPNIFPKKEWKEPSY